MSIRVIFEILLENRQGRHLEKALNTWNFDQNFRKLRRFRRKETCFPSGNTF